VYAVTGITGQIGGTTARMLSAKELSVRGVVHSAARARKWADAGAENAVADFQEAAALEAGFAEARATVGALRCAL